VFSLHRLAHQANRLLLYVAVFFIAWTIRATVLFPIDKNISSPALGQLYADVLRILIWVLPALAYLAWVDKKRPIEYLLLNTVGRAKDVFPSAFVVTIYFALILIVESVLANHPLKITITPLSNSWLKTVLVLTIAPIAEEILYRGFLLQKFQAIFGNSRSNLITSLLFVAIHWPNWLYTGKSFVEIGTLSVQIFILSLLLGNLVQRTSSLWPSILTHMLNNMISFFVG
jgi:membrane protease YdiL (CAAX protease family)